MGTTGLNTEWVRGMTDAANLAEKKSDNLQDYTDQTEDYDYWRGYIKGREDAGLEIRVNLELAKRLVQP